MSHVCFCVHWFTSHRTFESAQMFLIKKKMFSHVLNTFICLFLSFCKRFGFSFFLSHDEFSPLLEHSNQFFVFNWRNAVTMETIWRWLTRMIFCSSMMIKAKNIIMKERTWINRVISEIMFSVFGRQTSHCVSVGIHRGTSLEWTCCAPTGRARSHRTSWLSSRSFRCVRLQSKGCCFLHCWHRSGAVHDRLYGSCVARTYWVFPCVFLILDCNTLHTELTLSHETVHILLHGSRPPDSSALSQRSSHEHWVSIASDTVQYTRTPLLKTFFIHRWTDNGKYKITSYRL